MSMKHLLIFWVLFSGLLLTGCFTLGQTPVFEITNTHENLPTQSVKSPAPTKVATQTIAPSPTVFATPAPTPETALTTDGPYLIYLRDTKNDKEIVFMDSNGAGRRVIPISPELVSDPNAISIKNISPSGTWLAFYTGSAEICLHSDGAPCDLSLNLINLETGQVEKTISLLSKNYPENFSQAAKKLNNPDITASSLQYAFLSGITRAFSWSPDGPPLAFAGQMDGLSSDLYVYDVTTERIRRLSSGPQELQWINWSPDGKWIVHGSVYEVGMGMNFDIYAASLDGNTVKYLSNASLYSGVKEWLNTHEYFEYYSQNGPGTFGLRSVDIETGRIRKIWGGAFMDFSVDKDGEKVVLYAISPDNWFHNEVDPNFIAGEYLIDLITSEKKLLFSSIDGHFYLDMQFFGLGERVFSLTDGKSKKLSFLLDDYSTLLSTELDDVQVSVSPDRQYWIAISEKEARIFSKDDELLKKIPLPTILSTKSRYGIVWRPNSTGLFLVSSSRIDALDIEQGQVYLVETNLAKSWDNRFIWSVGQ